MKGMHWAALVAAFLAVIGAGLVGVNAQNTAVYLEQGGSRQVIGSGGSLDVASGGEIDIESGGSLKIAGVAWTTGPTFTGSVKLTPTDTVPGTTEGRLYADDSENALKFYNGSDWVVLGAAGASGTLDDSYDSGGAGAGRTITADGGPVVINNTDADAAFVLSLTPTPGSAAALGGLQVTVGGNSTEDAVQISNSGTGDDVQGSGSTWSVSKAGVITGADAQLGTATVTGALTASGGIALANGGTVGNDTDGSITFGEATETLSLGFTSNTVTLATGSGVDTLALGVVDDVTGIGNLAFDAAASGITLTADGAADDLTIGVAGAQNASLVLSSEGTAEDALQIVTTAGGINITNGGAAAGEDLDLASTNASVNLTAAEAATDAINIDASAGGVDIDAADDVAITVTSGSAGEDVLITQTGGNDSSITLSAAGTGADAIGLQASAGGVDIDGADDVAITVTSGAGGEDLLLTQVGAQDASITLAAAGTGLDAIGLQASAGGVDIDGADDVAITVTSGAGGEDVLITQAGAQDASITLTAAGTGTDAIGLQATAGGIDIDAVDDLTITLASTTDADDLVISQTGAHDASLLLASAGTGADAIGLTASAGGITLTGATGINVASNLVRASGTTETLNSDYQTEVQSVAFDIEEATMDADDGTGIKVAGITLNFNAYVVRAFANFSAGCGDAGDTCELVINNTDDVTSPTTTLDGAQDQSSAGLLVYTPAGSTSVQIALTDTTNKYVVVGYKDVGNDGSTAANLVGTLVVEYIRY